MCVYCFIADWMREYAPDLPLDQGGPGIPYPNPVNPAPWSPWNPYPNPTRPAPTTPPLPINPLPNPYLLRPIPHPWTQKQLNEAMEILKAVKQMEDALGGCPCEEPHKLDFLKEIQARLDRLKEKGSDDGEPTGEPHPTSD